MEAIRLIRLCARVVSERALQFAKAETNLPKNTSALEAVGSQDEVKEEVDAPWKRGWMPILYELFRVINKYEFKCISDTLVTCYSTS